MSNFLSSLLVTYKGIYIFKKNAFVRDWHVDVLVLAELHVVAVYCHQGAASKYVEQPIIWAVLVIVCAVVIPLA